MPSTSSICEDYRKLLFQWAKFNREYSSTLRAALGAQSQREREFLNAAIADIRSQTQAAKAKLEHHRLEHGCEDSWEVMTLAATTGEVQARDQRHA